MKTLSLLLLLTFNAFSKNTNNENVKKLENQVIHLHQIIPKNIKIDHFGFGESLFIYGSASKHSEITELLQVFENDKESVQAKIKVLSIKENENNQLDFKISYTL